MAKDVVEVAGDAFAFGYSGEGFDFFGLHADFAVGAVFLGEMEVGAADDEGEKDVEEGGPGLEVKEQALDADQRREENDGAENPGGWGETKGTRAAA